MPANKTILQLSGIPTPANADKLTLGDVGVFQEFLYVCTDPTTGSATFKSVKIDAANPSLFNLGERTAEYFFDYLSGLTGMPFSSVTSGAGSSMSANASIANESGAMLVNTGTASNGRAGIASSNLSTIIGGAATFSLESATRIEQLSTPTDRFYEMMGFGNITTGEPVNGVYFWYDDSVSPNWLCKTSATTKTIINSAVPVSLTYTRLRVVYQSGVARFFINDNQVASITTTLPVGSGVPMGIIPIMKYKTIGGTSRTTRIDYTKLKIEYSGAR